MDPPSEGIGLPVVRQTRLKSNLDVKVTNFMLSVMRYVLHVVGSRAILGF